jgi:Flp pilus assembly protein TadD
VALGNVLMTKGDLDGAEANYRAALAASPNSPGVLYNLGMICAKRSDLAGAEEWYRKAVAADPARPAYRQALDTVIRKRSRQEQTAPARPNPANAPPPPHP